VHPLFTTLLARIHPVPPSPPPGFDPNFAPSFNKRQKKGGIFFFKEKQKKKTKEKRKEKKLIQMPHHVSEVPHSQKRKKIVI